MIERELANGKSVPDDVIMTDVGIVWKHVLVVRVGDVSVKISIVKAARRPDRCIISSDNKGCLGFVEIVCPKVIPFGCCFRQKRQVCRYPQRCPVGCGARILVSDYTFPPDEKRQVSFQSECSSTRLRG